MKIAMVSSYTDNLEELIQLTWYKNKKLYCEKHNYDYWLLTREDIIDNNNNYICDKLTYLPKTYFGMVYTKVKGLNNILHEHPEYDWLIWCDADTLITNFNIKIESFLDDNYHFIVSTDLNGINAGVFCIRNSQQGRKYINDMLEYRNYFIHEQDFIIKTHDVFKSIIKIVPQKTFNSYCFSDNIYKEVKNTKDSLGEEGQWSPGDFLMHWAGTDTQQRLQLANKYIKEVIY